MGVLATCPK